MTLHKGRRLPGAPVRPYAIATIRRMIRRHEDILIGADDLRRQGRMVLVMSSRNGGASLRLRTPIGVDGRNQYLGELVHA